MTVNMSEIEFTYDFFSMPLPDGSTLILNNVDENIESNGTETAIKAINIVVAKEDGSENVYCSPVIGMTNEYFTITSAYSEYLGKVLDSDNMQYCTMEIVDE